MPKSLVEKLSEVAATIPNLVKQGDNGQFFWLRAVDVFEAIRGKLFAAGILIVPIAQTWERSQPYFAVTGDITDEVITTITYRITDGTESINCEAMGIGQDHQGKALYIASTGAKKDLLKSLFLIAGYEDDAEAQEDVERIPFALEQKIAEMEEKCGPDVREWKIGRGDVNAWMSACRTSKYSEKAKKTFLKSCGVEKISDLKRKDHDKAMKWATGAEDGEISFGTESDTTD